MNSINSPIEEGFSSPTYPHRRLKKDRIPLLMQIVMSVSIPLALLSAIFVALYLRNQITFLNQYRSTETQLIMERIHQNLEEQVQSQGTLDEQDFKRHLATLSSQDLLNVNIMDFKQKKLLWEERIFSWEDEDTIASAKSLELRAKGNRFYGKIDLHHGWLVFYMPLQQTEDSNLYIVRTIFSLSNIRDALKKSRNFFIIIILLILMTGVLIGRTLSQLIIKPLKKLEQAAEEITRGHLGKHIQIQTGNEFEALADTFNHMSDRIKEMQSEAKDANPLTQLPGNQGIFGELKKRIYERQKFVFFHIDLNRFKVFNDHYGLAHGDRAIQMTAETLRKAAKEKGSADTYVGHQGGDDFVIITHPSHAEAVGEFICNTFDQQVVPSLYPKEDFKRGYVTKIDRRSLAETGEEKIIKFPLISIAVAGVTNTKRDFADYYDCMEKAVKAKTRAKQTVESIYIIET